MVERKGAHQTSIKRRLRIAPVLLAGIALGLVTVRPAAQTTVRLAKAGPDLAVLTTRMTDLDVIMRVDKVEPKELEKIGRDFASTYALRTLRMLYKEPDKIRLDGKSAVLGDAMLIQNGTIRYYTVPKLKLNRREDLKDTPVKRQSMLEYGGLVTPGLFSFMVATYRQQEDVDGVDAQVYDLNYQGMPHSAHYRVWIDPKSHVTLKRAWYDSENRLKATFYYQEPHEVAPGVWLPTRIEVKNAEGVSAAVTTLEAPQINQGLTDDLFSVTP